MRPGGLVAGGQLDRYVLVLFGASLSVAFFLVVGIFLILDLSSNLDDFFGASDGSPAPGAVLVLRYYGFQVPFIYLQVAPLVTLLAGLFCVAKLVRHREVVAALAAGISSRRILAPILVAGALLAVLMVGLREWATESFGAERDAALDALVHRRPVRVVENVVLKDAQGNFVRVGEFRGDEDGAELREVLAIVRTTRAEESSVWVRVHADVAHWVDGEWLLEGGRKEDVDDLEQRRTAVTRLEGIEFTPRDVLVLAKARENPFDVSGSEARFLAARDPDDVRYRTLSHYHLSFPASNVVLLLVGLPFLMRFRRGRGVEGVALGFLLCVFYFAFDLVSRSLGMEGQVGPVVATWLPVLTFGSLGVALYGGMRS